MVYHLDSLSRVSHPPGMFNGQFSAHPALLVVRFMDCFSRMLLLHSLLVHFSWAVHYGPYSRSSGGACMHAVYDCFSLCAPQVRPLVDGRWCAFAFPSGVESSYASWCCSCAPPVNHTKNLRRHR